MEEAEILPGLYGGWCNPFFKGPSATASPSLFGSIPSWLS